MDTARQMPGNSAVFGGTPPPPTTTAPPPTEAPQNPAPGSGGSPAPPSVNASANAGSNSLPWLQPWQGGYVAPMSSQQNQALNGITGFSNNNYGLNGSQNYLNNLMSGQWLSTQNPYFNQIQNSADQLAQTQNARALQQLQSSAAAGGNALSGGLMQQESDYMRNSNAALQQMMGQLRANQYSQERGYMQQAPALQNMLANTQLGGLSQLMSMGGVPQQLGTQEMQGQYGDFLRQIQAMQNQYMYPDQMAMSTLGRGYNNSYQQQYGASGASGLMDLINQMLGSGSASGDSGLLQALGSLFGGTTNQNTDTQSGDNNFQTISADAHPVHYDVPSAPGVPTGSAPQNYGDSSWYQNALAGEVNKGNHPVANPYMTQYSGLNTGMGILGLLMSLIKGYGNATGSAKQRTGTGLGAPGGLGGKSQNSGQKGQTDNTNPGEGANTTAPGDPFGAMPVAPGMSTDNPFAIPAGVSGEDNPGVSQIDPNNYAFPNPYTGGSDVVPPSSQNQDLLNFLQNSDVPTGYGDTGGSGDAGGGGSVLGD